MKKRILPLALALVLVISFAACGNGNSPQQAAPPAASASPPASSEPAPPPPPPPEPVHIHSWVAANHQEPKTCSECEETEGSPLTPAFVEKGISPSMTVGTTYDYHTLTYVNPRPTVGTITINDYKKIESDETHPPMDGYEWKILQFTYTFGDDNANKDGCLSSYMFIDFYTGERIETYINDDFHPDFGTGFVYTVKHRGNEYDCLFHENVIENAWSGRVLTQASVVSYLVPIGYDGVVLAFINVTYDEDMEDWDNRNRVIDFDSAMNDADTLFFRLA